MIQHLISCLFGRRRLSAGGCVLSLTTTAVLGWFGSSCCCCCSLGWSPWCCCCFLGSFAIGSRSTQMSGTTTNWVVVIPTSSCYSFGGMTTHGDWKRFTRVPTTRQGGTDDDPRGMSSTKWAAVGTLSWRIRHYCCHSLDSNESSRREGFDWFCVASVVAPSLFPISRVMYVLCCCFFLAGGRRGSSSYLLLQNSRPAQHNTVALSTVPVVACAFFLFTLRDRMLNISYLLRH